MNRRIAGTLIGLLILTLVFGWGFSIWVPPYIQNLLQHPDGSYVSALLLKHHLKNEHLHTVEWYGTYVPAVVWRILWMWYLTIAFAILMATLGRKYLIAFWNHPSTAFNLGIFRIAILIDLLLFRIVDIVPNILSLSYEGMNHPFGYGLFASLLPPPAWFVYGILGAYKVLIWFCLFGFLTSIAMPLLTFATFFVLLFPHFIGKMDHHHHMWLVLFFLSLSPCADALSIDALIRRWRGVRIDIHQPATRYGRPLIYIWMMMGAIYFFPGFWKFAASGWEWAFSDNARLKILAKVFETGQQPAIPLYNYPLLCQLGAFGTLIFELAFPFAMLFPITRLLFGMGGLAFHISNGLITQINFLNIQYFYISFGNWSRVLGQSVKKAVVYDTFPRWKTVVCVTMVAGMWFTGATAIESWPWAAYPTFAPLEQNFVNSIEMRVFAQDGTEETIRLQEDPTLIAIYGQRTRLRAYMTTTMAEADESKRRDMLKSLLDQWLKDKNIAPPSRVEFWQIEVPLLPLNAPPVPYKMLGQF